MEITRRQLLLTTAVCALPVPQFVAAANIEMPRTCEELKDLINSMVLRQNATKVYESEVMLSMGFGIAQANAEAAEGVEHKYHHYYEVFMCDSEESGVRRMLGRILHHISEHDARTIFWRRSPEFLVEKRFEANSAQPYMQARYSLA
jgi:hypothetical protein